MGASMKKSSMSPRRMRTLAPQNQVDNNRMIEQDFNYSFNKSKLLMEPILDDNKSGDSQYVCDMAKILLKDAHSRQDRHKKLISEVLVNLPLFQGLTFLDDEPLNNLDFMHLAKLVSYQYLNPGEMLFKEGEKADKIYIILKGKLGVYKG